MTDTIQFNADYETLTACAGRAWEHSRRGLALQGVEAALAAAMELHTEWWSRWNWLAAGYADAETLKALRHIRDEALKIMQVYESDSFENRDLDDTFLAGIRFRRPVAGRPCHAQKFEYHPAPADPPYGWKTSGAFLWLFPIGLKDALGLQQAAV